MIVRIGTTLLWWAGAAVVALVLGGATSFLQTVLPDDLTSFANSNGGWAILTVAVLLVCTSRPSARHWWTAAGIGLLTFHLLLQGYAIVSTWRGFPDSYGPGNLYFAIATFVGPVIGLTGLWWWSDRIVLRALSVAFISAVMIGDGVDGLVFVSDTTGVTWWIISIVIGVGIAAYGLVRRFREARGRLLTAALVVVATGGYVGFWSLLRAGG